MINLGEDVTGEEVDNMMKDIDSDGDGLISYDGMWDVAGMIDY